MAVVREGANGHESMRESRGRSQLTFKFIEHCGCLARSFIVE
jgi:hypothetical protein